MNETTLRLIEPSAQPTLEEVEAWLGRAPFGFWKRVSHMITQNYPGVFSPEWLYGGKKHGWLLRYKKSKSFCTMIPEKNRFLLQIVFGAAERSKVETIRHNLSAGTRKAYDEAKTYHDGKWLLLTVDDEEILSDVERFLAVKRKPKIIRNNA